MFFSISSTLIFKVPSSLIPFANPYVAAAKGYVDAVIEPGETRKFLLHALEVLETKDVPRPQRKHGCIPL